MTQVKEGSIRKRSNGTFEYRVYVDKKCKSFYGKTEAEVKRKYREYKKNPKQDINEVDADIKLDAYIEYWLKMYKYGTIAESTYDRLENIYIKHIKTSAIANKNLGEITTDDIQFLINSKKTILSISSLKKIKEVLYPCFKYAKSQNIISYNPVENVSIPKRTVFDEQDKRMCFYSDEEVNLIVQTMLPKYYQINPRRYRYAPLYAFILNTGLRIGDEHVIIRLKLDKSSKYAGLS